MKILSEQFNKRKIVWPPMVYYQRRILFSRVNKSRDRNTVVSIGILLILCEYL